MISENFFASNYTSVWRAITPTMDDFVRRTNMDGYQRYWVPIESETEPTRRGLINEAGFILFSRAIANPIELSQKWARDQIETAFDQAQSYITGSSSSPKGNPSLSEKDEAIEICERIFRQFKSKQYVSIDISPQFPGCGIIGTCNGDVMLDKSKLYEIKSGDRSFRSIDFRQVAIYMALHFADKRRLLDSIHLLNPRTGIQVDVDISDFTYGISGQSPIIFCQNIINNFSSHLVSA